VSEWVDDSVAGRRRHNNQCISHLFSTTRLTSKDTDVRFLSEWCGLLVSCLVLSPNLSFHTYFSYKTLVSAFTHSNSIHFFLVVYSFPPYLHPTNQPVNPYTKSQVNLTTSPDITQDMYGKPIQSNKQTMSCQFPLFMYFPSQIPFRYTFKAQLI